MAVAAAELGVELQTFIDQQERPPEEEVYGRSLSSARRLGAVAVHLSAAEAAISPEAEQVKKEFDTSVEEGLGTDVEIGRTLKVRDFDARPVINGHVMSKDGKKSIASLTAAGLDCAEKQYSRESSQGDTRFDFQLTRSKHDDDNVHICDDMAQGKTEYNTRLVVTPFPQEAAAAHGDAYVDGIGYVSHLKRGFVQMYFADNEGFVAGSLSFEGSDKERIREILSKFGVDIPEDEVSDNYLQYAITDTLTLEDAMQLSENLADELGDPAYKDLDEGEEATNTVDLTRKHRSLMDAIFNDSYLSATESLVKGYQTPQLRQLIIEYSRNSSNYNEHYQNSLDMMMSNEDEFTDEDFRVMHELIVYSTIEAIRALHIDTKISTEIGQELPKQQSLYEIMPTAELHRALGGFGNQGAANGRGYSACGLEISPGKSNENEMNMSGNPQLAFGGNDSKESLNYSFNKLMFCVQCQAPPKEDARKKMCGPCGLCRSCDLKAGGKG